MISQLKKNYPTKTFEEKNLVSTDKLEFRLVIGFFCSVSSLSYAERCGK